MISLAFCQNSNNFPRLKAREINRILTKRAWNYSLISLVTIWLHILIKLNKIKFMSSSHCLSFFLLYGQSNCLHKCLWKKAKTDIANIFTSVDMENISVALEFCVVFTLVSTCILFKTLTVLLVLYCYPLQPCLNREGIRV